MRTFLSHGPINLEKHFGVPRTELVQHCLHHLVGDPIEDGGHYFTIWAPRQTGKTWIMQQVVQEVRRQYGDQFAVCSLSFEFYDEFFIPSATTDQNHLPTTFVDFLEDTIPGNPLVTNWSQFFALFRKKTLVWDRPVLLLIDEADSLPSAVMDHIVKQFRAFYLNRSPHWLHGLALIGVRSVLGIESSRGSPFNIQRSMHIPNLTPDEVRAMYQQYQTESGQPIEPGVVEQIYESTQGQPGLVSWFGELLTTTYNPGPSRTITAHDWDMVYHHATSTAYNATILNLIAKSRGDYRPYVTDLFTKSDIPFSFVKPWCNFLYMHGIIAYETQQEPSQKITSVCRFSSPYIQLCVYNALTDDQFGREPCPIFGIGESIAPVITDEVLNLPQLLGYYQHYLTRLRDLDINPWYGQPRRESDTRLTEAVGHFHLYAWILRALPSVCTVSPEFPTGNGKVDLCITCGEKRGIIEIKSFIDPYQLETSRAKAAHYARQLELDRVTLAVFTETYDDTTLAELSGEETIDGVLVTTVMIGWGAK